MGAPLIDPKPILDGWVALEDTSIFRARGENPFLATSPTVGQALLESKQQLAQQVLARRRHPPRRLRAPGRAGRAGSTSACSRCSSTCPSRACEPTVSGLPCTGSTPAAAAAYAPASASSEALDITAVNGVPIAGHQGPGSIADETVRRLLMLQGLSRPQRIVSLMSYPGAAAALASPSATRRDPRRLRGARRAGRARRRASDSGLTPNEWIELIDRLGEIPDPTVGSGHSNAAIPDGAGAASAGEGEAGGND